MKHLKIDLSKLKWSKLIFEKPQSYNYILTIVKFYIVHIFLFVSFYCIKVFYQLFFCHSSVITF